jgi:hypothetical protein
VQGGRLPVPLNRLLRLVAPAVFIIASFSSSAFAQTGGAFTCDASSGGDQEFEVPVSPHAHVISGRMLFESRDFGGSDIPSAHIAFADSGSPPDPGHCRCKGVRAQIFPSEPDTVKFYMVGNGHAVGMAQGPVGTPISFAFSIDNDGVMTASIGRTNPRSNSAKLSNPRRNRVHVTCSSARVQFLDLHME